MLDTQPLSFGTTASAVPVFEDDNEKHCWSAHQTKSTSHFGLALTDAIADAATTPAVAQPSAAMADLSAHGFTLAAADTTTHTFMDEPPSASPSVVSNLFGDASDEPPSDRASAIIVAPPENSVHEIVYFSKKNRGVIVGKQNAANTVRLTWPAGIDPRDGATEMALVLSCPHPEHPERVQRVLSCPITPVSGFKAAAKKIEYLGMMAEVWPVTAGDKDLRWSATDGEWQLFFTIHSNVIHISDDRATSDGLCELCTCGRPECVALRPDELLLAAPSETRRSGAVFQKEERCCPHRLKPRLINRLQGRADKNKPPTVKTVRAARSALSSSRRTPPCRAPLRSTHQWRSSAVVGCYPLTSAPAPAADAPVRAVDRGHPPRR